MSCYSRLWKKTDHRQNRDTDVPQFVKRLHPDKHIMRWKCDVKNAFNTIPLHFSGFPSWSCGWLGAGTHCLCPTSLTEYCTTYSWPRKKKSKFKKVWFILNACCFRAIAKLKNPKSNHSKWGTTCTCRSLGESICALGIFFLHPTPSRAGSIITQLPVCRLPVTDACVYRFH